MFSSASTFSSVFFGLLHFTALLPTLSSSSSSSPFSVSVRCSANSMEMFVQFREPFHGMLKTRPNGLCFVTGRGRNRVGLRLPLDDDHRQKCAIVRRDKEYVAIVDLEMNTGVVTAEDNAYFVRCPIGTEENDETEEKRTTASSTRRTKASTENEQIQHEKLSAKIVTQPGNAKMTPSITKTTQKTMTTMEHDREETAGEAPFWREPEEKEKEKAMLLRLGLTFGPKNSNAFPVRLRKCVAFSPSSDGQRPIRAVQISDENGCPIIASGHFPSATDKSDHHNLLSTAQLKFEVPKFGDDQQPANGEERATDKFIVQCEVAMNGGGEGQMGEEEEKPCLRTPPLASETAARPPQRLLLPPSDASPNGRPSSSSPFFSSSSPPSPPSSSSSLVDRLSFLSLFLSAFLIFFSLGFVCFIFYYCPNVLRMNDRKWNTNKQRNVSAPPRRCFSAAATASISPFSSASSVAVGIAPGAVRPPVPLSPLAFSVGFLPVDDASHPPSSASARRPFSPPLSSADFASSLDCLPEPPSLTLDEVRQLNDAFNGTKTAESEASTFDRHDQCQQRKVYSFAGIRLNNRNENCTTERH
ncbi:hypothetical protein niasHS_007204 [Heterodera schachtii]|uniref:ZP domain-containing protein n=1 Tax=Heterodera schachtii TaxID=97005 RepID=A0ABD2JJM2_HETSC